MFREGRTGGMDVVREKIWKEFCDVVLGRRDDCRDRGWASSVTKALLGCSHHQVVLGSQPCASTHHLFPFVFEMGNEKSTSKDRPSNSLERSCTLEARDLPSVAKYMKSDECKNVFVLVSTFDVPNKHL
jgi:hypothetical protein